MVSSAKGPVTPGFSIDMKDVDKLLVVCEAQERLKKRLEDLVSDLFPGVQVRARLGGFDFSGPQNQVSALKAMIEQLTKVEGT